MLKFIDAFLNLQLNKHEKIKAQIVLKTNSPAF